MQSPMGNCGRFGYCKFFRGLIASRQPNEIIEIVQRYEKDLKSTESGYIDIVLKSNGVISWQDIMTMPVDSIQLLVERINHQTEERNSAMKSST